MDKAEAIRRIRDMVRPVEAGREYRIDAFRPEDAWGVARLFYSIYGEDYPVEDYYIPERLIEANRKGDTRTVVARLDSGEVVGQTALYRGSPPNPGLFEFGQMLILPEYRHSFIAMRLMTFVRDHLAASEGVDGFFGEAVCHHLATQKMSPLMRTHVCGLELALMPDGAYAKEGAHGRVSCLLAARVDRDCPGELHLPQSLRQPLSFILEDFNLDRRLVFAARAAPSPGTSQLSSRLFDFAAVLRCQALAIGEDFPAQAQAIDRQAHDANLAVVQVFMNAADPGAVYGANMLREMGFFLGGLVPLWFPQGDALLLQKLYLAPDFEAIRLFGDRAKTLLGHIRQDYTRTVSA